MKQITNIRKSVCIMANELKKAGYSLSEVFKKAWRRVKLSMTIRAAGVTFENRQERLQFLKRFPVEDLHVTLEREPKNQYDRNAIRIIVHIRSISRKTVIGYVPKGLSRELSKVIDAGAAVKAAGDYRRLWIQRNPWNINQHCHIKKMPLPERQLR